MTFDDIDKHDVNLKVRRGWLSTTDLLRSDNAEGKILGFDYAIPVTVNGYTNYLTCVDNGYDKNAIFTCGVARIYDYSFEISNYLNSSDTEITELQDIIRIVTENRSYKFLKFMNDITFNKIIKRNITLINQLNERLANNNIISQIEKI